MHLYVVSNIELTCLHPRQQNCVEKVSPVGHINFAAQFYDVKAQKI